MIKKTLSLLILFVFLGSPLWANNSPVQGEPSPSSPDTLTLLPEVPLDCPDCHKKGPLDTPHDPVLLTGGKFFLPVRDVNIPGIAGSALSFQRSYSSQDGFQGVEGAGWVSILDIGVYYNGGSTLVVRNQTGALTYFVQQSPTLFTDGQYKVEHLADGTYLYTFPSGDTDSFNSFGKPLNQKDPNGNAITFNYTGNLITSLSDASGRRLTFTYNANSLLTQMTDPLGRSWHYTYDALNNLVAVTDPLNRITRYAYQDTLNTHSITSITDPMGFITSYQYNSSNQVTKQTKPDGSTIQFSFNNLLGTSTMIDEFGRGWPYEYVLVGLATSVISPNGGLWQYTYDANSNQMTSFTSPLGPQTKYIYDQNQNLIQLTDALGNQTKATYDTSFHWLTRTDANGHTSSRVLDAHGNPLVLTDALGKTTTMVYDTNGQMTSSTDRMGNTTSFVYDTFGNLIKTTNASGNSTTYTYDTAGRKTSQTDANNHTTQYTYDNGDRITQITLPDGTTIKRSYDADDRMLTQTDANGNVTSFTYGSPFVTQGISKPASIIDALGNVTRYTYDAHGNVLSITDADGKTTSFVYGTFDHLGRKTDALGNSTLFAYDLGTGDLGAVIDANGNATSYNYDNDHRLTMLTNQANLKTLYSYDNVGNLIAKTDFMGQTINYSYDQDNRLIKKTYPDSTSVTNTYNAEGKIISMVDPTGTNTYTYDPLYRKTKVIAPGTNNTISYTYDAVGNRLSMTNQNNGVTSYVYDTLNRVTSLTNPQSQITKYTYDLVGNALTQTDANGTVTVNTYNKRNQIVTIQTKNTAAQILASSSSAYDPAGLKSSITQDNGNVITYTYDVDHHLIGETKKTSTGTVLYSYAYTYDPLGNRLSMNKNGVITTYTYNDLNQLTQSKSGAVTNTYTYDNNGNQIKEVISGKTTTSAYDFDNRLTKMTYADGTSSAFVYSADDRRLKTTEGAVVTNYLYDGDLSIIERNVSNVTQNTYTIGIGYPGGIGSLVSQIGGTTTSWYHYVHNGDTNINNLTNTSGAVVESYDYDAFGNIATQTGTIANTRQFQTKEVDAKSGLSYFGERWYDPTIGRWTTPDPLKMIDGPNMYLYADDDPVNFIDPDGLDPFGHHLIPQGISKQYSDRIQKIWNDAKNRLDAKGYKSHNFKPYRNVKCKDYNKAVEDKLKQFLKDNGVNNPDDLTDEQAQEFANEIRNTTDGDIGAYNTGVAEEIAEYNAAAAADEGWGIAVDVVEGLAEGGVAAE